MKKLFWPSVAMVLLLSACGEETSGEADEIEETSSEETGGEAEVSLTFSHFFPSNHIKETDVVDYFITELQDRTDGQVEFESYPGGQLAEPDGQYEAAATNVADAGFSVHSYTPSQFPLTSVMELPFVGTSGEEASQTLWDLYDEFPEIQEEYEDTYPLWLSTSEPGQIFTVDQPVESPEDLEGLQIRSPSPEVNAWLEEMGATPVSMSMDETYEALERGVVDGTVGPPHTLLDYSLQEVIDYVTVGDFYMTTFFAVMNQGSYEMLDEEAQQALDELAGAEMSQHSGQIIDEREQEAMEAVEEAGAEVHEVSDDEAGDWEEGLQPVIDDWIERMEEDGLPGQEVYDRAVELGAD
ncbi:TRAP transporter substrate-binding protein [Salsuginibacillus kocurii]|uniref:TRAP transporter substrate-binding protein n=1 Tax=Salsuginibacillus kocurii TaxID=427078 RepID=UPI000361D784|nr:TRAP transporter substrate-binding protein [Salsuginibacillus kocurii]